jgi:hypothetical protein
VKREIVRENFGKIWRYGREIAGENFGRRESR